MEVRVGGKNKRCCLIELKKDKLSSSSPEWSSYGSWHLVEKVAIWTPVGCAGGGGARSECAVVHLRQPRPTADTATASQL